MAGNRVTGHDSDGCKEFGRHPVFQAVERFLILS